MRILIADDHPIARRGLQMIISEAFGDADCAEAADTTTALTLAGALRPDLVLVDMHMPGDVAAPALCRMLRAALPHSKIVIVTAFHCEAEIRDCLLAGADGCLLKDTSETDMAEALRTTMTGNAALDPRIAYQLARDLASEPADRRVPRLSARERNESHGWAEVRASAASVARHFRPPNGAAPIGEMW